MLKKSVLLSICLVFLFSMVYGDEAVIQRLREQGEREGWTFTVGQTPVSDIPLERLCGLVIPDNWKELGVFEEDIYRNMALATPPASYDLNTLGFVTSVKNQESCGSCWAFSIIGSYESAILFHGGPSVDLSEQWLLDCNSYGYICSGGFFDAWNDLYNGVPLESCYPYTAVKGTCNTSCPKYFPLISWAFVGSSSGVPSTTALKQAIYDHGGISAAVIADTALQNYTGGIFNSCSSASPNHAIVLVGWDDAGGYLIMKNSWGTGWGENGYCKIAYGCSKIGYAACYGIPTIQNPPSKPVLVSPVNGAVIATTTPTLTWSAVTTDPAVDNYRLYIYLDETRIYYANTGTSTSHTVPSGTLEDGKTYKWLVNAHNALGWSGWSERSTFTVDLNAELPPQPVLVSPANGATVTTTPTLSWHAVTADPAVNNYQLKIFLKDTSELIYETKTHTSTSHTVPSGTLEGGETYKWKIRAHNAVGWGIWSAVRTFTTQ